MPRSALEHVEIDYRLPSGEIGALLGRLALEPPGVEVDVEPDLRARMRKEIEIAAEDDAFQKGIIGLGTLTPFTCPECHGTLVRIADGRMSRFRCHTGHAYTANSLLEGVTESTGELLWQVIRGFEEAVMLVNHMGQHLKEAGNDRRADAFFAKARELEKTSKSFHSSVQRHQSLSAGNLGQVPE